MEQRDNGQTAGNNGPAFRDHILHWLPTVAYIIIILIMAMRPAPKLPRITFIDKYLHAAAYGVLATLAYRSFGRSGFRLPALLSIVLALAVGAADEGLQYLSRVRTADLRDLLADLAGAIIGTAILWSIRKYVNAAGGTGARRS